MSVIALNKLRDTLSRLKEDFEAATTDGVEGWQKRLAAFQSIAAVVDFMAEEEKLNGLDFGLRPIIEAMSEIEKGRVPEWLTVKKDGHPGLSDREELLRAKCAGVLQFLMNHGFQRLAAARLILEAMPPEMQNELVPYRSHASNDARAQSRAVAGWRDRLTGSVEPSLKQLAEIMNEAVKQLDAFSHRGKPDLLAQTYIKSLAKHLD